MKEELLVSLSCVNESKWHQSENVKTSLKKAGRSIMQAISTHPFQNPVVSRLGPWVSQVIRWVVPERNDAIPAEFRRMSDRLLRDIGVDPRSIPPEFSRAVTAPDMLHSGRAMAEFLATTVR
jgi:uncharacterized protein YjiS (DUF1127 family)